MYTVRLLTCWGPGLGPVHLVLQRRSHCALTGDQFRLRGAATQKPSLTARNCQDYAWNDLVMTWTWRLCMLQCVDYRRHDKYLLEWSTSVQMVDTVYIPATMTNLMRMTAYIITFLLQVAATQVNRQKCSAKTLHTSGLQVIDSPMDLQFATGNLPGAAQLEAWYHPHTELKCYVWNGWMIPHTS